MAQKKPTGEGNHSKLLTAALRANNTMMAKSHAELLDNFGTNDEGPLQRNGNTSDNDGVIKIIDNDNPCPFAHVKAEPGAVKQEPSGKSTSVG